MTRSELVNRLAATLQMHSVGDVEYAVKALLDLMREQLAAGRRIEIRGFGSFSVHRRLGRMGRNPKTGQKVAISDKYVPYFKPARELRGRVTLAFAGEQKRPQ